ncbi:YlbL family protein [Leucobacter sp. GX24907]
MKDPERERRRSRQLLTALVAAFVVVLVSVVPSPYVIERPGPVVNTLGDIQVDGESEPVIRLEGTRTHPTSGSLNLVAVTMVGSPEHPTKWIELLWPLLDDRQELLKLADVFPEGVTAEQRDQVNTVLMGSSQSLAAVAALRELGQEVDASLIVSETVEHGPADGVLGQGDQILSVAGRNVESVEEVRSTISETGAGKDVDVVILRGGEEQTVVLTPETPEDGGDPMLGVIIATDFDLPFEMEMSVEDIGGPSAGTTFALAIYDMLTAEDLTGGLDISGTGTIDEQGKVGAIGGLPQKIWGASTAGSDLFFMPLDNCGDVPDRLPKDLRIVPVGTLGDAISAIELAVDGGEPDGLERCSTE